MHTIALAEVEQGQQGAVLFGGLQSGERHSHTPRVHITASTHCTPLHLATLLHVPVGTRGASDELFYLPLDSTLWGGKAVWVKVLSKGQLPCARFGHSMTALSPTTLLVYGGMTTAGDLLTDLHVLEIQGRDWCWWVQAAMSDPPAHASKLANRYLI
jgi:hypothetical protein